MNEAQVAYLIQLLEVMLLRLERIIELKEHSGT